MKAGYLLKPCPVCGDKKVVMTKLAFPKTRKKWGVWCEYCRKKGPRAYTRRGAAKLWNKSTNVIAIRDLIKH